MRKRLATQRSARLTERSAQFWRPRRSLRHDLFVGLGWGLTLAAMFSAFILLMAVRRGSTVYQNYGGLSTWHFIAYYFGAGAAGGAAFGLLRPMQHRYVGKFLTAYLILLLVYGGGTAVVLPTMNEDGAKPVPVATLVGAWAVLCLILAPIYVRITRDWSA